MYCSLCASQNHNHFNTSVAGTVGARQTYEIVTMQLTCAYNSYTHIVSTYVVCCFSYRVCAAITFAAIIKRNYINAVELL